MYSRQIEQLASKRSTELRSVSFPARRPSSAVRPAPADRPSRQIKRQTGWALVAIGLRLAESGTR